MDNDDNVEDSGVDAMNTSTHPQAPTQPVSASFNNCAPSPPASVAANPMSSPSPPTKDNSKNELLTQPAPDAQHLDHESISSWPLDVAMAAATDPASKSIPSAAPEPITIFPTLAEPTTTTAPSTITAAPSTTTTSPTIDAPGTSTPDVRKTPAVSMASSSTIAGPASNPNAGAHDAAVRSDVVMAIRGGAFEKPEGLAAWAEEL